jgi:hypothetical protein
LINELMQWKKPTLLRIGFGLSAKYP